jgi:ABC-type polysaccharide/polyol phosphate export permease
LVLAELKVKYRGSVLGFLWSLLNPLALIVIYSIAFRYIIRIPIERFTVFLIAGLLPWSFFAGSAMASTVSLMINAGLLKKVHFPREILPASTVLFNLIQMLLALAVFLPSLVVLGRRVPWTLVYYPAVLGLQVLFVLGVALGLSALTVVFRDLRHLTEVGLTMLFWLTPVVYHVSMVPERLRALFLLNPMAAYVSAYQEITYWGRPLSAGVFATMTGWALASLLVGWTIFRRRAPYLAEDL